MTKKLWFSAAITALVWVVVAAAPTLAQDDDDHRVIHKKRDVVVITGDGAQPNVLRLGHFGRGYLGVTAQALTPELRTYFGVPEDVGVIISRVEEDGPAANAGVQVGDILTGIDNEPIADTWDVVNQISHSEKDTNVNLEIWREGKMQTLLATVGERSGAWNLPTLAGVDGLTPEQFMAPLFSLNCDDEEDCSATFEFKTPEMGEAMERMRAALPRVHDRVFSYQVRGEELEQRMKELEARLQEMQQRLEDIDENE